MVFKTAFWMACFNSATVLFDIVYGKKVKVEVLKVKARVKILSIL